MESATRKRKSLSKGSEELSTSSIPIKTRRLENSSNSTCSDRISTSSCCSSDEVDLKCADLEQEHENEFTGTSADDSLNCRREAIIDAELSELESTARPHQSSFRPSSVVEKMPSEAELEEFFATAEKTIQKKFIDKYNFDIVKDEPLEGRYEWVKLQVKAP